LILPRRSDLGVTKKESSNWQLLAEAFRRYHVPSQSRSARPARSLASRDGVFASWRSVAADFFLLRCWSRCTETKVGCGKVCGFQHYRIGKVPCGLASALVLVHSIVRAAAAQRDSTLPRDCATARTARNAPEPFGDTESRPRRDRRFYDGPGAFYGHPGRLGEAKATACDHFPNA
jgi:hypothetical protein